MSKPSFQAPKGTRDLYPADMLRRRYITDAWRRVALRHGFDEIDGPTFENASLYAVKSGDGILGEMFGVYSGKDPGDIELVQQGKPPFALRPEFTPTLARMYAARARQLPQPTKWFCVSNFFRAERPQRGRLREFWQWNCDVLGSDDQNAADVEVIGCAVELCHELGLHARDWNSELTGSTNGVCVHFSNRLLAASLLCLSGVSAEQLPEAFVLLDRKDKMPGEAFLLRSQQIGLRFDEFQARSQAVGSSVFFSRRSDRPQDLSKEQLAELGADVSRLQSFWSLVTASQFEAWCAFDPSIVRGLAYYTGTVFEVIAEGERAVAGGGRYDNLIELFGGPPTPACGFGMGDVVLGNLLDDKGLMPDGPAMLDALSRPMPVRPDAFIIAANDDAAAHITPLTARLRRGTESPDWLSRDTRKPWDTGRYTVAPLHARRTYKTTRNVGKLLADANACHARWAVIIENAEVATLKNLDTREERKDIPLDAVAAAIASPCH